MNKTKIASVRIEYAADTDPDTSCLGTYTDEVSPYAILRVGCEHYGEFVKDLPEDYSIPPRGREFRFFLPSNHVPHNPKNWEHCSPGVIAQVVEQYGSLEKTDENYAKQDFERMEALNRGDWSYIGIIAKAEIVSPHGTCQTIHSGGLWGIESDSDAKYLVEVENEQLDELKNELLSLGLGERAIERAFQNVQKRNV